MSIRPHIVKFIAPLRLPVGSQAPLLRGLGQPLILPRASAPPLGQGGWRHRGIALPLSRGALKLPPRVLAGAIHFFPAKGRIRLWRTARD